MDYPDYRNTSDSEMYRPICLRTYRPEEAEQFSLLVSDPDLVIHDTLHKQLAELLALRSPEKKLSLVDLNSAISKHLGQYGLHEYGVWVFYPWARKLVHVLDEAEFYEVRTSRNLYKITPEEQRLLATKTVGIVGLSVGSAIAYTMAMERSCSRLKLADFDTFDLSNLNRVRAKITDLGLNKAIVMAREIAEMDPFLDIEVFEEGLTTQNMASFIGGSYPIDLLIDECDSLTTKIQMRQAAQKAGIPVLMETSDRGMLDVERFDIEPQRLIFHGRLKGMPLEGIETMPPQERMLYLAAIVDFNGISDRLKWSYGEIGKTITTWPQLASAVILGGGSCADVARRILLQEGIASGRYYVDISNIVPSN
jgi:molybdopterin/thiamine biosynthesis adenylyltransferase